MSDELPSHPFWRFSCALRMGTPVRDALKHLHEQRGLNRTFLLFCCWYASTGRGRLTQPSIEQLRTMAVVWHEKFVVSLKELYKTVYLATNRSRFQPIQEEIEACIQDATLIEHLLLADMLLRPSVERGKPSVLKNVRHACYNIINYCKLEKVGLDSHDRGAIYRILSAVFPQVPFPELMDFARPQLTGVRGMLPPTAQGSFELD